jgi:hypothetical protein
MVEKLSPSDAGTILEGSTVRNSDELDLEIIRYAFEKGMPAPDASAFVGEFDLADKSAAESDDATALEWFADDLNIMADKAVEWLNENVAPSGFAFEFMDGLVLSTVSEETGEEKTIEHYRSA